MSGADFIERELSVFAKAKADNGLWAVATQCLYPSNEAVTVFVAGGPRGCIASDNGGAIGVLTERGIYPAVGVDAFLRPFCRGRGLHVSDGTIVSPALEPSELPTGIVMVANASAEAARWGVDKLRRKERRNVKKMLFELLTARYSAERIQSHVHLTGASTRVYPFEHVVSLDGKRLVVDSVVPEASAINAKTIAHLDLANQHDATFIQRIVYDDEDEWRASDLNLMKMGAPLVALRAFGATLDQMRVHG